MLDGLYKFQNWKICLYEYMEIFNEIYTTSPELQENVVLICAGMFCQIVTILHEVAEKHILMIAQTCVSLCTNKSPSYYKLVSYSVSCRQGKELSHT